MKIKLINQTWNLGAEIGSGGFGRILEASTSTPGSYVAKLVPKYPGSERELLFEGLAGIRSVVPIIDNGETTDHWVLVMPRAEQSLRDRLNNNVLTIPETLTVMSNVCDALVDLIDKVVHRDIKPENTLFLNSRWCLSDFGISRYAEASTDSNTQKYSLTGIYAAPERWEFQRATSASDVYSFGIMSYEMLAGKPPFVGSTEDLRESHLFKSAATLNHVPPSLAALVAECLAKPPKARPSVNIISERLKQSSMERGFESSSLERLARINTQEVTDRRKVENDEQLAQSKEKDDMALFLHATEILQDMSNSLYETVTSVATAVVASQESPSSWILTLRNASLKFGPVHRTPIKPWDWDEPAFNVIAQASISIELPLNRGYRGRSHSLWYCDAHEKDAYQWYETAFMSASLNPQHRTIDPISLDPGMDSAQALWVGSGSHNVAWPFEPLNIQTLDGFISRWVDWFAAGADGELNRPSVMPERSSHGTWRSK